MNAAELKSNAAKRLKESISEISLEITISNNLPNGYDYKNLHAGSGYRADARLTLNEPDPARILSFMNECELVSMARLKQSGWAATFGPIESIEASTRENDEFWEIASPIVQIWEFSEIDRVTGYRRTVANDHKIVFYIDVAGRIVHVDAPCSAAALRGGDLPGKTVDVAAGGHYTYWWGIDSDEETILGLLARKE